MCVNTECTHALQVFIYTIISKLNNKKTELPLTQSSSVSCFLIKNYSYPMKYSSKPPINCFSLSALRTNARNIEYITTLSLVRQHVNPSLTKNVLLKYLSMYILWLHISIFNNPKLSCKLELERKY